MLILVGAQKTKWADSKQQECQHLQQDCNSNHLFPLHLQYTLSRSHVLWPLRQIRKAKYCSQEKSLVATTNIGWISNSILEGSWQSLKNETCTRATSCSAVKQGNTAISKLNAIEETTISNNSKRQQIYAFSKLRVQTYFFQHHKIINMFCISVSPSDTILGSHRLLYLSRTPLDCQNDCYCIPTSSFCWNLPPLPSLFLLL